jgi:hypothetical protein
MRQQTLQVDVEITAVTRTKDSFGARRRNNARKTMLPTTLFLLPLER